MKLFLKPGACSLSPHIVLEESGLPYETECVDLQTKVMESGGDFWKVNPKGYVPALLLDSGELLTEGPAIVQYVADQVPAKKLAPPNGSIERYRLQGWLNFIATELHRSCTAFFHPLSREDWKAAATANLQRRLAYTNEHLADKSYLLGDEFSVADAYLFTVLRWMKPMNFDISAWTHLVAYQARIGARSAVDAVLRAEGLL